MSWKGLEQLLDVLAKIDDGDELIFSADEGGVWQINVDWNQLLPVYLAVLAVTATADEYADRILGVVNSSDVRHERDRWLEQAIVMGSPDQAAAIRRAS